jgi:hypothetical protein
MIHEMAIVYSPEGGNSRDGQADRHALQTGLFRSAQNLSDVIQVLNGCYFGVHLSQRGPTGNGQPPSFRAAAVVCIGRLARENQAW